MKLTSLEEMMDEHIGRIGTKERDKFENELRIDLLGEAIKHARKGKHLTQAELGELLGVNKTQISKLENNTKESGIGTILRALKALGATVK